jgi:hypothetical protein
VLHLELNERTENVYENKGQGLQGLFVHIQDWRCLNEQAGWRLCPAQWFVCYSLF